MCLIRYIDKVWHKLTYSLQSVLGCRNPAQNRSMRPSVLGATTGSRGLSSWSLSHCRRSFVNCSKRSFSSAEYPLILIFSYSSNKAGFTMTSKEDKPPRVQSELSNININIVVLHSDTCGSGVKSLLWWFAPLPHEAVRYSKSCLHFLPQNSFSIAMPGPTGRLSGSKSIFLHLLFESSNCFLTYTFQICNYKRILPVPSWQLVYIFHCMLSFRSHLSKLESWTFSMKKTKMYPLF